MPVTTDGTTFINPIGLGFAALMCLLMLVVPRRYALVPVIILTFYMTMGERIMVVGLNFNMIRILTVAGWIRLILWREIVLVRLNAIDQALIIFIISSVTVHTLLWQTSHEFINRLGHAYDSLGLYFLFRFLIRDISDVKRAFKIVAILIVPLGAAMLAEKLTGRNPFFIFGGVMEFTRVRDGSLRCQGPFAHPILAGTVGATLLPWFVAMWWEKKHRVIAGLAIVAAALIVVTSASSGPALAAAAGLAGLMMWYRRRWLRAVRWSIFLGLLTLHMVMKAPVWWLMARADVFGGSTGWHRAWLIDTAVNHISEWWLLGIKDSSVWDPMLADVTNEYLWQGFNGGVITMLLFIVIIVICFRSVGISVRRMANVESLSTRRYVWALGACLLAHVLNYLSISYFDQNFVLWFLLLAMITTCSVSYRGKRPRAAEGPRLSAEPEPSLVSGAHALIGSV
jgi:hypothetical protein